MPTPANACIDGLPEHDPQYEERSVHSDYTPYPTIELLAAEATHIVRGTVMELVAFGVDYGHRSPIPFTASRIRVEETLKGQTNAACIIVGGIKTEYRAFAPPGTDVVLFLGALDPTEQTPIGRRPYDYSCLGPQGMFLVEEGRISPHPYAPPESETTTRYIDMPVETFLSEVREIIAN